MRDGPWLSEPSNVSKERWLRKEDNPRRLNDSTTVHAQVPLVRPGGGEAVEQRLATIGLTVQGSSMQWVHTGRNASTGQSKECLDSWRQGSARGLKNNVAS